MAARNALPERHATAPGHGAQILYANAQILYSMRPKARLDCVNRRLIGAINRCITADTPFPILCASLTIKIPDSAAPCSIRANQTDAWAFVSWGRRQASSFCACKGREGRRPAMPAPKSIPSLARTRGATWFPDPASRLGS